MVMVPWVGVSRPPSRFSSVVLPEPDGPIRARKSPDGMSRFTPCRTSIRSPPRRNSLWRLVARTRISLDMDRPLMETEKGTACCVNLLHDDAVTVFQHGRRFEHQPFTGCEARDHLDAVVSDRAHANGAPFHPVVASDDVDHLAPGLGAQRALRDRHGRGGRCRRGLGPKAVSYTHLRAHETRHD